MCFHVYSTIETDHQNLQWLEKNDSAIVMRWRWYLQNYQTLIRHIPGKKNVVADYFSRMYSMSEEPTNAIVNQDDDQEAEFDVCQFYGLNGSDYKEAPTIKLDLKHARLTATVNIKTTSDMSLAFSNFIQQYVILYTIPYNGFNFTFKKQKILGSQTPNDLGLKDGDEIIVTGEPYVPDGYVANSSITSIMESDDIKELGSIHFLGRPTKKSSRANSNRRVRFLNTDTNEVEAHLVQMNAAKSRSTVSKTYLAQQTHLNYKIVDGKVTLPVFLTLKHTDLRRMALETELDFVVLDDQSGFVIGYPHLTYTFKTLLNMLYHGVVEDAIHDDYERYDVIASDDADTEAEAIEKAKPMLIQPGLNPLHLVTLPKRLSDLPDQLRQHVMACKRTAELVNIDDPSIIQRVVIKLDSGMENIRSAVSIALVHQYPELFKPTYYEKPISGSTSLSGHPVSCLGETTLLIRLQHDTTGLWTESQIRLRIVDAQERSYLILSYFDSIRHFYDIYMRIHETFRTCLQLELDPSNYINPTKDGKQLFPDGILSPPSRQIIFRRDGQIVKDPAIHAAVKQSLPTVHNLVEASEDGDDSEDAVMFYNIPTDFFKFPVHYLNHITLDDDEGEREGDQGILGINNDNADTNENEDLANIINELNEWMKEIHGGFNLHLGAKRTYAKAKERFPGHKLPFKFFEEYVASCGTCQKQRASMGLAFRALVKTLKLPLKPRACVGVDTLSLPEDKYGYKYVHIIVQLFSKLVFAYPSKNNTADSVCDALLTYFATHGLFNVMSIDPGNNLLAETVDLLNRQLNITQKVSMVDVHTSNGVENSGCKPIIRHLQALTSDFRIKDRWSEPKCFQWCLFMINSSMNSEINNIPFALHYGDYDKLAEKYPDVYPSDKETRSAYIKDLWQLQRIATDASRKYQQGLHDRRVAVTPVLLANQYQPGDYVLRLREIPINNNKLQRLKYRGPYKVLKQEGNRVYVSHCSNNKEDVFPVEKLVIFDNSRDEAFKVAQLDDDEFLVLAIVGYKGNPLSRQSTEFLVQFEDEEKPIWVKYSQDLATNETFREYCKSLKCLEVLIMKANEIPRYVNNLNRLKISLVKPGDRVYVDLRTYSLQDNGRWYDNLNLDDAYTKQYVLRATYGKYSNKENKIQIHFELYNQTMYWANADVQWYGTNFDLSDNMVLVDDKFAELHPQVM